MKKNLKLLLISLFASMALAGTLTACSGGSSSSSNDSGSTGGGNIIDSPVEDVKITISGSATVTEFEKITLVAEVTGSDEAVVWKSSDTTVATVEDGVVTALKAGSVVITASVGNTSATHNLTVEPTTFSHELNFSVNSLAMFAGESGSVKVSIKYKGQTLDNTAYGIKYTWTLISGEAETATMNLSEDGASLTVTSNNAGSVIYRVSATVRGYEVSKDYVINVYEAIKELGFENNKFSPAEGAYNLDLSFGSAESEQLTIGNVVFVINGEPTSNVATVTWQSDDSETVVVEDGVIKALKAGSATLTGTATYEGETLSVTVVVKVLKKQVELTEKMTVEAVSETITLPEEIEESVIEKVTINTDNVVYDKAAQIGSADGKVITVSKAAMPSKMEDLGLGKTMTVETDRTVYTMPVDVYTMIISNRDELDQWQSVAAENAVKAGLCLEVQKGFVLSGYFIMDSDIAYNKQWTVYKDFGQLWRLSTDKGNPDAVNLKDADGNLLPGVVDEAWNYGIAGGFQGTFDGMGHNISGMEVVGQYNGFIVVNGTKGVVQNVSFTDAKLGEQASLVVGTGRGIVRNVYMEIDSFAEGAITLYRSCAAGIRTVERVLIDVTDCKLTSLNAGWIGSQCDLNSYKGVYVIGVGNNLKDKLFADSKNSTDIGGFTSMEALLADETHGAVVKGWDKNFWQIGAKYVLPKDLVSSYGGDITFANVETTLNLGSEIILSTDKDAKYIVYSLKQAVNGVSLNGNVLSVSSTATSGATVTVVATSVIDGKTAEFTVEIASPLEQVSVNEKFYAETVSNSVLLKYDGFKVGNTYTITVNGTAATATVETEGQLLATVQGLTAGNTYSVECKDNKELITFTNVFAATQILKTAEDLNVLNGGTASANISGYYILGGDINCEDALYEAGTYNNKQFTGIFDGNGYTISNIKVGSCGIFGVLSGATVKNVNFTGVSIAPSHSANANYGNYAALLAGKALNSTTIENVNVTFKEIQWPFPQGYTETSVTGVLVARFDDHVNFIKNVTIDATGLTITNALGCTTAAVTYQNVKVLADDVVLIACTGNDSKSDIGEWPTGVTYVDTLEEIVNSNKFYADGGVVTVEDSALKAGESYTVVCNGETVEAVCAEAGKLTATFANLPVGAIVTVTCKGSAAVMFDNVFSVSKVIKTVDDLRAMDATTTDGHLRGYYVLGGDLDCEGATFSAGAANANKTLLGTFDGQGYTISNLKVGSNGLFSVIQGTVKNVNFTGVSIVGGDYNALLAARAWGNATIENVNVTYEAVAWPNNTFAESYVTGLLVARWSDAATVVVKDVVLDATGLAITNALGVQFKGTFTNVTVKGDSVALIACTGANSSTGVSEWPTGVTYVDTLAEIEITEEVSALDGEMTLISDSFVVGEVYTVKSGLISVTATVEEAGKLSVTLEGVGVGTISVSCKTTGKEIIFSNVKSETSIQIEEITVTAKCYADGGVVTLESENFVEGESYNVTCGAAAAVATVTEAGKLTATLTGLAVGETLTVTCASTTKIITFTNVFSATKVLRTADDLKLLDAYASGGHLTGYYVLGGDINCNGMIFESAARDPNKTFMGTFDGDGHTISNIKVGTNGIFSVINGGTVKNVNFTGASLVQATNAGNHMTAFFAGQAWGNVTIENVYVQYDALEWPCFNDSDSKYYWAMTGMLVARWAASGSYVWKDVTLDATGLQLTNVLGCDGVSGIACQNVKVLGDSYVFIGSTTANLQTPINEWPAEVEYVDTLVEIEITEEISALDGEMTLASDSFVVGEVYTVKSGLISVTATVEEAGKLSVTLEGVGVGTISVNCKTAGKEIIFSNVKSEISEQMEEITVTAKCYADGGVVTLESEKFVEGESYNVTCGAAAAVATVTEAGKLTATLTGLAVGETFTVTCVSTTKTITFTNVFSATKVLRTADDLNVLNATAAGAKLTGYYVLGGNIDCADALYEAKKYDGTNVFSAVFDGQGYTISNIKVGACGILGTLVDGTVKNVNFTGVSIAPSHAADANYGNYCAVLAGSTWGKTTIENVNVSFKEIQWPFPQGYTDNSVTGLLVARFNSAAVVVKNVTIDATGLTISCALGCTISAVQYENVKILADEVTVIGTTDNNMTSSITEWPTGVTYTCTKSADSLEVTAPAASEYYTFNGAAKAESGKDYTFTVTEKVSGLNDFIVLVNGEEITGDNGTYTVANVAEALEIKVIHGYIQHGSVSSVSYNEDGVATVTNSTSTDVAAYMAYISADYVNYLLSKGYTHWDFYIVPDGTIANQAIVGCGNTIVRTVDDGATKGARVQLKADTVIKFWCQQDGSGSKIQEKGGYMTVTYGEPLVVSE